MRRRGAAMSSIGLRCTHAHLYPYPQSALSIMLLPHGNARLVLHAIARSGKLASMGIVEVNPYLDHAELTQHISVQLLLEASGFPKSDGELPKITLYIEALCPLLLSARSSLIYPGSLWRRNAVRKAILAIFI